MTDRFARNRRRGTTDRAVALPLPARQNDQRSMEAELFVADRYDLPTSTIRAKRPDDGYDFAIRRRDGGLTTIDVKWTPRRDGRLVAKRLRADVYVLVVGEADMEIVGWAWRHTLRAATADLGHGPVHALRQDQLRTNVDLMFATLGKLSTGQPQTARETV